MILTTFLCIIRMFRGFSKLLVLIKTLLWPFVFIINSTRHKPWKTTKALTCESCTRSKKGFLCSSHKGWNIMSYPPAMPLTFTPPWGCRSTRSWQTPRQTSFSPCCPPATPPLPPLLGSTSHSAPAGPWAAERRHVCWQSLQLPLAPSPHVRERCSQLKSGGCLWGRSSLDPDNKRSGMAGDRGRWEP